MADTHLYEGVVRGGPLDGKRITNNASKGFVLVDLDNKLAWVHDYNPRVLSTNEFNARGSESLDEEKLTKAQEDGGRSVMAWEEDDND